MTSQSPHVVTVTDVGRGRRRVGRTGDGYRYDHAHCTADLTTNLLACDYIHQPRLDRLSDHSALSARLAVHPGEQLITSDPAAASAPPTLF